MAFEDYSPEQLRLLLKAAYTALADYEAKIRCIGAGAAKLDDENERIQAANNQLLKMLTIDPLTGVASRLGITETIEKESIFAKRRKTPLCLIFFDIDRFKEINDGADLGHEAGDAILRQMGARLRRTLRPYDEIGRWAGDEFIVVLRDTTLEQAGSVAERLRKIVADKPFEYDGKSVTVTISQGVAERQPNELAATLVHRADQAMYRAKERGGNHIVLDGRPQ